MSINYLYIILVIFNLLFLFFFKKIAKIINIFDYPDKKRKIHLKKTASIGGVLIFFNLLIFCFFYIFFKDILLVNATPFSNEEPIVLLIILLFFVGIFDDKFNLNANLKFILFFFGFCLLLLFDNTLMIKFINFSFVEDSFNITNISFFFTVLSLLLFINAFNMFDGLNLQSSIYSLFFFIIFILRGAYPEICIVVVIALLFFSYLNYNDKCFLGNNGSLLISSIISIIAIKSTNTLKVFKADEIFLMMLLPGLDLLRLLFVRILKHRHPFSADRNHIHHILLRKFGYIKTLLIISALIIIPNYLSIFEGFTIYCIIITLFLYSFIIYKFNK